MEKINYNFSFNQEIRVNAMHYAACHDRDWRVVECVNFCNYQFSADPHLLESAKITFTEKSRREALKHVVHYALHLSLQNITTMSPQYQNQLAARFVPNDENGEGANQLRRLVLRCFHRLGSKALGQPIQKRIEDAYVHSYDKLANEENTITLLCSDLLRPIAKIVTDYLYYQERRCARYYQLQYSKYQLLLANTIRPAINCYVASRNTCILHNYRGFPDNGEELLQSRIREIVCKSLIANFYLYGDVFHERMEKAEAETELQKRADAIEDMNYQCAYPQEIYLPFTFWLAPFPAWILPATPILWPPLPHRKCQIGHMWFFAQ